MQANGFSTRLRAGLLLAGFVLLVSAWAAAQHEKVLYNFDGTAGANPVGNLVFDSAGNLYGTTAYGGASCGSTGCGVIFELSPNGSGGWTETLLHSFGLIARDGKYPFGGLVFDVSGNLLGTTWGGGIHNSCNGAVGCGTMFEMVATGSYSVVHSFGGGTDGAAPESTLLYVFPDTYYGTTTEGGIHSLGTVFKASLQNGTWVETVLHSFGSMVDGATPFGALVADSAGNLYGTTFSGGIHCAPYGCGTVFKLALQQNGTYTETILHSFGGGTDGQNPYAGLVLDGNGNLFGTTTVGGIHSLGTAFELKPRQGGGYTTTVLHSFGGGSDGQTPYGTLAIDANGNLYGTTHAGGTHMLGTVFKLAPNQGGGYTETILRNFGSGTDGAGPDAGVILDSSGNLYGTTYGGGTSSAGVVYEITP